MGVGTTGLRRPTRPRHLEDEGRRRRRPERRAREAPRDGVRILLVRDREVAHEGPAPRRPRPCVGVQAAVLDQELRSDARHLIPRGGRAIGVDVDPPVVPAVLELDTVAEIRGVVARPPPAHRLDLVALTVLSISWLRYNDQDL